MTDDGLSWVGTSGRVENFCLSDFIAKVQTALSRFNRTPEAASKPIPASHMGIKSFC